jgi:hypothetical protein
MRALLCPAIAVLAGCPERAPIPAVDPDPDAAIEIDGSAIDGSAADRLTFTPPQQLSELMVFGFHGDYDDPSLTADLLELTFGARPRGDPLTDNEDIWRATREQPSGPWTDIARVDELSTEAEETGASISLDGLTIVFARVVDGRGFDLFIATRVDRGDPWGVPAPIAELNSPRSESPGQLSLDGLTLYFASDRAGDFDIFAASRPSLAEPFAAPEPIPVASVFDRDELSPAISADDNELTFAAADEPPFLELYLGRRDDANHLFNRAEPIVELNSQLSESDLRFGPNGRFAVMASDRTVLGRNRIWTTSR